MIVSDARIRIGCSDFAPAFSLHRTEIDPSKYHRDRVIDVAARAHEIQNAIGRPAELSLRDGVPVYIQY